MYFGPPDVPSTPHCAANLGGAVVTLRQAAVALPHDVALQSPGKQDLVPRGSCFCVCGYRCVLSTLSRPTAGLDHLGRDYRRLWLTIEGCSRAQLSIVRHNLRYSVVRQNQSGCIPLCPVGSLVRSRPTAAQEPPNSGFLLGCCQIPHSL